MAITRQKIKISIDLTSIVNNSVITVKNVQAREQARKESEFQKAVAAGMSYETQLKFREDQLELEKKSSISSKEYISQLGEAIAGTKKLIRFQKIRDKYKKSLDDYVVGKGSLGSYISTLESTFRVERDEGMRDEINKLLSEARAEQSKIEINAIKNRAIVASKDHSVELLDKSIEEINDRKVKAIVNENDEEVSMWEDTLLGLRGSKSKLQIDDGINEIAFQSNRLSLDSTEKLDILNGYVSDAASEAASPVVYEGTLYPSMEAFWDNQRNQYISNGYFADIKTELDAKTATIASSSRFGQVPVTRIDSVNNFYNELKTRPEFSEFIDKIEQHRVDNLNSMVTNLAESIYNEADSTEDFTTAQNAILNLENKFGIKVSRQAFGDEGKGIARTATEDIAVLDKPGEEAPADAGGGQTRTVVLGDTLSKIASESGVSLNALLIANPKFRANPNLIQVGENIVIPAAVTIEGTPAPEPVTPVVPTPAPAEPAAPVEPVTPEPTPTVNFYTVKPGDTLSQIALNQLGDASRAFDFKSEAGETFDDETAKNIQIGQKLIIPT